MITETNNQYQHHRDVTANIHNINLILNQIDINHFNCRYCFDPVLENFIQVCQCQTPVHRECLRQWRRISHRTNCEICHARYT